MFPAAIRDRQGDCQRPEQREHLSPEQSERTEKLQVLCPSLYPKSVLWDVTLYTALQST